MPIEPDVLLLDEPLSALDANLREEMRVELKNIQRRVGVATVFVTHDQGEALAMSDIVVVMNKGKIEQMGAPAEVYEHPQSEFVANFLGNANFLTATLSGGDAEGVQVRLVDAQGNEVPTGTPGEIQIKGPNVMKGYWNLPDATAEAIKDGWFSAGDIAVVDADGYYYVVDRKKDLIIRGGYNVYPREVEEALHEHPAVAAVAVIGIPHESLGEEVGAAVVLKPGASATLEELRQFVKGRVAAYKYPRRIWFVDSLPTGPTGKLLRREVKPPPSEEA